MELYLIRHTRVAVQGLCYGQTEVPLADTFEMEAALYQEKLKNIVFEQVFCSPLSRCTKLADYLALSAPITYPAALLEMNFGLWEGQTWDSISPASLLEWTQDFVRVAPPQGENLQQMFQRVKQWIDRLREQPYERVLCITHAGVIRCVWAYLLEFPLSHLFKIPVGYGEVLVAELGAEKNQDYIKQMQ